MTNHAPLSDSDTARYFFMLVQFGTHVLSQSEPMSVTSQLGPSLSVSLTGVEVIGLGHFDSGSGLLLNLCDGFSSFADDGAGGDAGHEDF